MELADYWFFETAVRLHREGEGAPYTGLKPAGLDWGSVVPRADKALKKGDPEGVIVVLTHAVEKELQRRFNHVMAKKKYDVNDVDAAREYVQANLSFVLYAHHLYTNVTGVRNTAKKEWAGTSTRLHVTRPPFQGGLYD